MLLEHAVPQDLTRAGTAAAQAFARVDVFDRAEPVLDDWAMLETAAPCSVYQTRAWLLPWMATLGRKAGLAPLFVLARRADGKPAALLCLALRRQGRLRIATWQGGKDANFNMALLRNGDDWTRAEIERLFAAAAQACPDGRPDVFLLPNVPIAWQGETNPLTLLRHQESPSAAYGTALTREADALFAAKLSKETRKKLRKKEAKLAALGPLAYRVASDPDERAALIDAFLRQKTARFRAQNIASDFTTAEMRAFIEAASASGGITLHALYAGERIVATYGGAAHRGQWSGMFNAFDAADEEVARSSPGDLLLMRIVDGACRAGSTGLDLGIGEARYKAALCDEAIPLADIIAPITASGRAFAAVHGARQRVKRAIKQNPRLFACAKTLRTLRVRSV